MRGAGEVTVTAAQHSAGGEHVQQMGGHLCLFFYQTQKCNFDVQQTISAEKLGKG
jgi:hypothetical protein